MIAISARFSAGASGIPSVIRSRGGAMVVTGGSIWIYPDATQTIRMNFALLPPLNPQLLAAIRYLLAFYVENYSGGHASSSFEYLKHFLNYCYKPGQSPQAEISSINLLNYREGLEASKAPYVGRLSGLLKRMHKMGLAGVSADAFSLLNQWRIKGGPKGVAVLTMDVHHGPYSEIELQAIHAAIDLAFEKKSISVEEYCLVWLTMLLAIRTVQTAALKISDFSIYEKPGADPVYCLAVPRAKQRHVHPRVEYSHRVLVQKVGRRLAAYLLELKLKMRSNGEACADGPMFPAYRRKLFLSGYEKHSTAQSIGGRIVKAINKLNVVSERTGQSLHPTSTRFRRTLGTRLAAEGHGELIIAELLDHSDTQNVGVYVQSSSQIVERIDRAVAMRMAPLAQAFAGVLISDESQAERGHDPSSRIVDPRIDEDMHPMGSCGKHGFCGYLAPIACYTCLNFQPWLDGPHEAVLNHLIAERTRLLLTDTRVAMINDRSILAVAQVIRMCDLRRNLKQDG